MGVIAAAAATAHVLMAPDGVEARARRIVAGMAEIGMRLRAARPDVVALISSDHLTNFDLDLQVPFAVGVADEYIPFGEMEIPRTPFPGQREFAEALIVHAAGRGFDLAAAAALRPDHGVALPVAFINRGGAIPVVPIYINVNMDPPPSPKRCWALGQTLAEFVQTVRPARERVAIVGAGGLSHWLGVAEEGRVNEAFDRAVMDALVAGKGHGLAQWSAADIRAQGGNGGLEALAWIAMAGAVPDARGETIFYEPMPEWLTGLGGVAMTL